MSNHPALPNYSTREEIANSVTHGIGLLLAITGLIIITLQSSRYGNAWHVVSCTIFASTLILQYTFSTLYHGIRTMRMKRVLRVLDHSAIFLLIAGTYTPFTLVSLGGGWGWALFGTIWGLALLGMTFQLSLLRRWKWISLSLYIGMGWVVVVAIKPLLDAVDPGGILLLVLGGLSYTCGVIFYVREQMVYHHAIWHLFVLAGSMFHFFAVLFYVVPMG